MDGIIKIHALEKSFGDVKAVDGIDFEVERGSLFAFLGVNGAGKSTTINVIASIIEKDSGSVIVDGYDIDGSADKIKSLIGIVFQGSVLDKKLSVKDNLAIRGSYYGLFGDALKSRLDEIAELLDLKEIMKRPYGKLSGGQRRRVDIARALINTPKILILDEPTTGLDPQTRKSVWDIINKLRQEKSMTVFLTTHYMEEANEADNVVIIDKGKIVAEGTPVSLKNRYSKDYVYIYCEESEYISGILDGKTYSYHDGAYKVVLDSCEEARELIVSHSDIFGDFEVKKGDMDDVFLNVTGRELQGGQAE